MTQAIKNRGWSVTFAGTGINLALGVLYTWSIFQAAIKKSIDQGGPGAFAWDPASLSDPYAVCCLVFAFSMILAGKVQDRFGPRVTAMIGGALVGAGLLLVSQSSSYAVWVLGFGVLAGAGIGFGYSSATPPALKWFPSGKTGLIAGLVVAGFGLAPVYIAPLATYLLGAFGLHQAMMIFGVAFFLVVTGLASFLVNPPAGFVPGNLNPDEDQPAVSTMSFGDSNTGRVLRTLQFWKLWVLYFIGSGAGLMVIGSVASMAKVSMGEAAFVAVAIMAVGNASGRIIAGVAADAVGRRLALAFFLALQAVNMFLAIYVVGAGGPAALMIVLSATFIGFNYGTNLALFPAFAKAWWGLKSFGTNYGCLMTAWGVGGFVMSRISSTLVVKTGGYTYSFALAGVLLLVGAGLALTLQGPRKPV
ncbi:MAG: OFA family MFS transporter [Burkholderiales bacterium]|nr:OFA family MFS transporter [Burkholderiales bacterium]